MSRWQRAEYGGAVSFERALGAHVMPVTKGGYAHAFRLARDVLPSFR